MNTAILRMTGYAMGPLVAAVMFLVLGNTWEKWICMIIVFFG